MKFKVDESLPDELSQLFGDAGSDSLTIEEQRLSGELDEELRDRLCEHTVMCYA